MKTKLGKSVSETRVIFHIWRHGLRETRVKKTVPDSINGVTESVPSSISRSDLLVVDTKMEAQETKLYNTLHHWYE